MTAKGHRVFRRGCAVVLWCHTRVVQVGPQSDLRLTQHVPCASNAPQVWLWPPSGKIWTRRARPRPSDRQQATIVAIARHALLATIDSSMVCSIVAGRVRITERGTLVERCVSNDWGVHGTGRGLRESS